jgi:mevalonate kinase
VALKVSHKIFSSKILLFGEHIINKGAMGLAVPIESYDGLLKFSDLRDRPERESNSALELFANYIIHNENISTQYDTTQFLHDIDKGLYFDSNIPQGYGLGSSGALVAAIYHQYRKFKRKNPPLSALKNDLAQLESYFHGRSSGLDAIVCYLHKAVLLNKGDVVKTFDLPESDHTQLKIFLLNTHQVRNTSTFVNLFLEKYKDKKFAHAVDKSLIPTSNIAINSFIAKNYVELMMSAKLISQLQFDLLPEFIPKGFQDVWKQGLQNNEYHLKVCGAGGGGFIIGFAKEDAELDLLLKGKEVIELMKF